MRDRFCITLQPSPHLFPNRVREKKIYFLFRASAENIWQSPDFTQNYRDKQVGYGN